MRYGFAAVVICALAVCACAGDPPKPLPGEGPTHPRGPSQGESLLRYDANHDGQVTWAELNAGLKTEFAAADTNHDGLLDVDEVRAVNAGRLKQDGTSATPLIDWNSDGHVDFQEFSAAPRSLFNQLDRDNDGVLTQEEIKPQSREHRGRRAPIAPFGPTPG